MSIKKKWILQDYDENLVKHISDKFNISPVVAKIIINRGVTSDEDVYNFINVSKKQFFDPFLLENMNLAVECIKASISANEKIAVYGDYDVDGITSTYILYDYLRSENANAMYYIPDRAEEGYGINNKAIDFLYECGVKLIISVDVGITAVNEVEYASSKGIKVVITDHHTPTAIIPDAEAVINPKLPGCKYPNANLAGVGVAFKLIYALSACDDKVIDKYCEMACIGTIADMVPLMGENRFIAWYGLKKLSTTSNVGLKALMNVSGIDASNITSSNISFAIAPRLNAAGRIASATTSVNLFLSETIDDAAKIAENLDNGNKIRQNKEQSILDEAIEIIEKHKLYNNKVIVVAKEGWHHGIIGIVSSKITEKYYKPSAVISINEDGSGKASGRSVSGFNLFDALASCDDILDKFGGHELAAGFSLKADFIDVFNQRINSYADGVMTDDILTPKLKIDVRLEAEDITLEMANNLKLLEPHGIGNRSPLACINAATVSDIRIHKYGKHAFVSFEKSRHKFVSPAFNMADEVSSFSQGDEISLAGTININNYRGVDSVQFITKDIAPMKSSLFGVDNMRCVYMCIRDFLNTGSNTFTLSEFSDALKHRFGCKFGYIRLKKSIEVLVELGIISCVYNYDKITVYKEINFNSKCDIESSHIFNEID